MSRNIFVESSIYNFGAVDIPIIEKELAKVKNPKWRWDEGNLIINEDFDMRHIEAILRARKRGLK